MPRDIVKPIFFSGMPRSGTTITFATFATHPHLGWFSTYQDMFTWLPQSAVLSRVTNLPGMAAFARNNSETGKRKGVARLAFFVPKAREAYALWRRCCGEKFPFEYLLDVEPTPAEADAVRRAVRTTLAWQGKPRFTTKTTGPGRLAFLSGIFADAVFVHVIRDGRAVVNSLMNHHAWTTRGGLTEPWWKNGLPEDHVREWKDSGGSAEALAAVQWKNVIETTRAEAERLGDARYLEVRYEDFVADPVGVCDRIYDFSGLDPKLAPVRQFATKSEVRSMNYKYRQAFGEDKLAMLNRIMGAVLERVGYPVE